MEQQQLSDSGRATIEKLLAISKRVFELDVELSLLTDEFEARDIPNSADQLTEFWKGVEICTNACAHLINDILYDEVISSVPNE